LDRAEKSRKVTGKKKDHIKVTDEEWAHLAHCLNAERSEATLLQRKLEEDQARFEIEQERRRLAEINAKKHLQALTELKDKLRTELSTVSAMAESLLGEQPAAKESLQEYIDQIHQDLCTEAVNFPPPVAPIEPRSAGTRTRSRSDPYGSSIGTAMKSNAAAAASPAIASAISVATTEATTTTTTTTTTTPTRVPPAATVGTDSKSSATDIDLSDMISADGGGVGGRHGASPKFKLTLPTAKHRSAAVVLGSKSPNTVDTSSMPTARAIITQQEPLDPNVPVLSMRRHTDMVRELHDLEGATPRAQFRYSARVATQVHQLPSPRLQETKSYQRLSLLMTGSKLKQDTTHTTETTGM
jgi:hypothetical protein